MEKEETSTFEVEIERILPGGIGLAHFEGRTLFVPLSAPGDFVRVNVDRVQGRLAFASIREVVNPSPSRVEPPCPYFGRCGGCDFQQLSYPAQLRAKSEIIRDCLYRIARIAPPPEISVRASPKQWHYRARANWQLDPGGGSVGYFERGSHRVCDVAECAVLVPALQNTLEAVRSEKRAGLSAGIREIEVVAGDDDVSMIPEIADFQNRDVTRRIGDKYYQFNAGAFFQTNHDLLEELIAAALQETRGATAVDLYCGVGLFMLPLAQRFTKVIGIEANSAASRSTRRNLEKAGLTNATVMTARVADWLNHGAIALGPLDLLLLDPPRTGAEPGVVEGILSLQPRQIAYVSCDPATLARDLRNLFEGGYTLDSISAFDMFPQTHHVETVVNLRRE